MPIGGNIGEDSIYIDSLAHRLRTRSRHRLRRKTKVFNIIKPRSGLYYDSFHPNILPKTNGNYSTDQYIIMTINETIFY